MASCKNRPCINVLLTKNLVNFGNVNLGTKTYSKRNLKNVLFVYIFNAYLTKETDENIRTINFPQAYVDRLVVIRQLRGDTPTHIDGHKLHTFTLTKCVDLRPIASREFLSFSLHTIEWRREEDTADSWLFQYCVIHIAFCYNLIYFGLKIMETYS